MDKQGPMHPVERDLVVVRAAQNLADVFIQPGALVGRFKKFLAVRAGRVGPVVLDKERQQGRDEFTVGRTPADPKRQRIEAVVEEITVLAAQNDIHGFGCQGLGADVADLGCGIGALRLDGDELVGLRCVAGSIGCLPGNGRARVDRIESRAIVFNRGCRIRQVNDPWHAQQDLIRA